MATDKRDPDGAVNDPALPEAQATEQSTEETPSNPSATDALISEWFVEHFHNSPVSRDGVIYALVQQAVEVLKTKIKGI